MYTAEEAPLAAGDLVFACTDGLTEARREGRQFGDERLEDLLAEHARRLDAAEPRAAAAPRGRGVGTRPRRRRGHPRAAAAAVIEARHEPPDSAASVALWEEYMALVSERAGPGFQPTEHIFASVDAFRGPGSAWIVLYDGDAPVACAGLRELEPGVAEIKRMYVTPRARGRGHARRLLAELEGLARERGGRSMRLFTTDLLPEAMALYASEGYTIRSTHPQDGSCEYWLEKPL